MVDYSTRSLSKGSSFVAFRRICLNASRFSSLILRQIGTGTTDTPLRPGRFILRSSEHEFILISVPEALPIPRLITLESTLESTLSVVIPHVRKGNSISTPSGALAILV